MDAYTNRRLVARDLKRRLLVWQALSVELGKKYDRLERLFRKSFGDEKLVDRTASLPQRVAALSDALDAILDT